jgi:hypothetical protein
MSEKYPIGEDGLRPYTCIRNPQPEWLVESIHEGLMETVLCLHLVGLETYVAEMSDEKLLSTLTEAESLAEDEHYSLLCHISTETLPVLETVKAEIAYRGGVDARRLCRQKHRRQKKRTNK